MFTLNVINNKEIKTLEIVRKLKFVIRKKATKFLNLHRTVL